MHAKSLQSCPTLCHPMDNSPPGFSVHRIPQARILEWVAISFSKDKYTGKQFHTHVCTSLRKLLTYCYFFYHNFTITILMPLLSVSKSTSDLSCTQWKSEPLNLPLLLSQTGGIWFIEEESVYFIRFILLEIIALVHLCPLENLFW